VKDIAKTQGVLIGSQLVDEFGGQFGSLPFGLLHKATTYEKFSYHKVSKLSK
jgi:hypothetical protein